MVGHHVTPFSPAPKSSERMDEHPRILSFPATVTVSSQSPTKCLHPTMTSPSRYHALTSKFSYHTHQHAILEPRPLERGTHLGEISRNDSPICEFSPRKSSECFACRVGVVVLDVNLAYTCGLSAAAAGAGHFHLEHGAVLLAFFLYVFAYF